MDDKFNVDEDVAVLLSGGADIGFRTALCLPVPKIMVAALPESGSERWTAEETAHVRDCTHCQKSVAMALSESMPRPFDIARHILRGTFPSANDIYCWVDEPLASRIVAASLSWPVRKLVEMMQSGDALVNLWSEVAQIEFGGWQMKWAFSSEKDRCHDVWRWNSGDLTYTADLYRLSDGQVLLDVETPDLSIAGRTVEARLESRSHPEIVIAVTAVFGALAGTAFTRISFGWIGDREELPAILEDYVLGVMLERPLEHL